MVEEGREYEFLNVFLLRSIKLGGRREDDENGKIKTMVEWSRYSQYNSFNFSVGKVS